MSSAPAGTQGVDEVVLHHMQASSQLDGDVWRRRACIAVKCIPQQRTQVQHLHMDRGW